MQQSIIDDIEAKIEDCSKQIPLKFRDPNFSAPVKARDWYAENCYDPCYSRNQNVIRSLFLLRLK